MTNPADYAVHEANAKKRLDKMEADHKLLCDRHGATFGCVFHYQDDDSHYGEWSDIFISVNEGGHIFFRDLNNLVPVAPPERPNKEEST